MSAQKATHCKDCKDKLTPTNSKPGIGALCRACYNTRARNRYKNRAKVSLLEIQAKQEAKDREIVAKLRAWSNHWKESGKPRPEITRKLAREIFV